MEPNSQENYFRKLFETNDSKNIWKAINWSGSLSSFKDTKQRPSDEEFKDYFESLLNPSDAEPLILPPRNCPYLPVTDDPFTPEEILNAIKQIKPDKSGSPSGVPQGFLKSLPVKVDYVPDSHFFKCFCNMHISSQMVNVKTDCSI